MALLMHCALVGTGWSVDLDAGVCVSSCLMQLRVVVVVGVGRRGSA